MRCFKQGHGKVKEEKKTYSTTIVSSASSADLKRYSYLTKYTRLYIRYMKLSQDVEKCLVIGGIIADGDHKTARLAARLVSTYNAYMKLQKDEGGAIIFDDVKPELVREAASQSVAFYYRQRQMRAGRTPARRSRRGQSLF